MTQLCMHVHVCLTLINEQNTILCSFSTPRGVSLCYVMCTSMYVNLFVILSVTPWRVRQIVRGEVVAVVFGLLAFCSFGRVFGCRASDEFWERLVTV